MGAISAPAGAAEDTPANCDPFVVPYPPAREGGAHTGLISDRDDREDIGQYAGWGTDDDLNSRPQRERGRGPSIFPYLATDPGTWRRSLGCLWIPALILLITIEEWLHVPQAVGWLSILGLFVVFLIVVWRVDWRA